MQGNSVHICRKSTPNHQNARTLGAFSKICDRAGRKAPSQTHRCGYFLRAAPVIDINLRQRPFLRELRCLQQPPQVRKSDVEFGMQLLQGALPNIGALAVHWMDADRQTIYTVILIEKPARKTQSD